jgi:hypothetical protein
MATHDRVARMQIRIGSGSFSTGLGVIGTGLAMAFPDQKWIGFVLIAIGLLIFLFDIRFEHGEMESGDRRLGRLIHSADPKRRMIALLGMIIFGLGFIGCTAVYFWPKSVARPERSAQIPPVQSLATPRPALSINSQPPPHLLLSLYMTEESHITGGIDDFTSRPILVTDDKWKGIRKVYCRIYYNKDSHAKYVAVYITHGQSTFDVILTLVRHIEAYLLHSMQSPLIQSLQLKNQGESTPETPSSYQFSGRVYIYHEDMLGPEETGDLSRAYRSNGMTVQFRGNDYMLAVWNNIMLGLTTSPPEYIIKDDKIEKLSPS